MAATESTGLNAAYVAQLREDFLDSPASVPDEWRRIFEAGENGAPAAPAPTTAAEPAAAPASSVPSAPSAPAAPAPVVVASPPTAPEAAVPSAVVDEELLAGVAAAMALVKAYRMHGHLAARLDPLGSEPMGDPALDETRLIPALTPELQERIPTSLLRVHDVAATRQFLTVRHALERADPA